MKILSQTTLISNQIFIFTAITARMFELFFFHNIFFPLILCSTKHGRIK